MGDMILETDLLVIGGGPGGYAAAFRAADLGIDVTLVDTADRPGGECLYRGCIPSKSLLCLSQLLRDARRATRMGITFGDPRIDIAALRQWKQDVIDKLSRGLMTLVEKRGVQYVKGRAYFETSASARIRDSEINRIDFKHAVIATGSSPAPIPSVQWKAGSRIMNSDQALALADIPPSLLIVGGGYIGLELGAVYSALGSRVTLVEQGDRILSGADPDVVQPLAQHVGKLFHDIHLKTTVESLTETPDSVSAVVSGMGGIEEKSFDRVLIAVGRSPNSGGLGLENTRVILNERGFIEVDDRQRTADPAIFAVGDVAGGYMLAHKATREGKVAAEVIAGKASAFDVRAIPAVVFTDPQVAWCGMTEQQAAREHRPVKIERFPWRYSGRAVSMDAAEGVTKIIADPGTGRILGAGICGRDAEGLIAEAVLAIEMGALTEDLALVIHAHPTLSETEGEAAEMFFGSATHVVKGKS
jgi:dihydrolipoamide dehydrogenase